MATTQTNSFYEGSDFTILSQAEATRGTNPDGSAGSWDTISASTVTPNHTRPRTRPATIRADKQSEPGVTTSVACTPAIVVPFRTNHYNAWLAALNNNDTFTTNQCDNSTIFQSFYLIQQGSGTDDNFAYPGAWPSGGQFTLATNGFGEFTFNFFAEDRIQLNDASITDPINSPTTQPIFDAVTLATVINWDGGQLIGVNSMTLNWAKDGAEQIYEVGSPASQGVVMGALNVTAQAQLRFASLDLFNDLNSEKEAVLEIQVRDKNGKGYNFSMPQAIITNFGDPINGAGVITATVDFEANPNPYTLRITEIP